MGDVRFGGSWGAFERATYTLAPSCSVNVSSLTLALVQTPSPWSAPLTATLASANGQRRATYMGQPIPLEMAWNVDPPLEIDARDAVHVSFEIAPDASFPLYAQGTYWPHAGNITSCVPEACFTADAHVMPTLTLYSANNVHVVWGAIDDANATTDPTLFFDVAWGACAGLFVMVLSALCAFWGLTFLELRLLRPFRRSVREIRGVTKKRAPSFCVNPFVALPADDKNDSDKPDPPTTTRSVDDDAVDFGFDVEMCVQASEFDDDEEDDATVDRAEMSLSVVSNVQAEELATSMLRFKHIPRKSIAHVGGERKKRYLEAQDKMMDFFQTVLLRPTRSESSMSRSTSQSALRFEHDVDGDDADSARSRL